MPYKLLLADDSVTIQRVIELTFADEDIQVLAVGDGKKAIASIQSDHPDIVLADVGMPERDGYEVASFVKTTAEFAHIPVLLLTGAFEPIDEARAKSVGCDGVLVKPFEPQMVINRVKDLLAGRRSPGPSSAVPSGAAVGSQRPADTRGVASAPTAAPAGSLEDYFDRLDAAFATMEGPSAPAVPEPPQAPPGMRAHSEPPPQTSAPAAFSQPASLPHGIADWDPDLSGDPAKPAAIEPPTAPASQPPAPYVSAPYHSANATPQPHAPGPFAANPSPVPAETAVQPPPRPQPAPSSTPRAASAASHAAPAAQAPAAIQPASAPPAPTLAEAFAALLSAEQARPIAASGLGTVPDSAVEEIVQRVVARMADTAVRETVVDVAERLVREEIERIKSA
ncbi:MAG: response regulator [Acidobacteriota bacterium]